MNTRRHVHQIDLPHNADHVFSILIRPSSICQWWGASRAIVIAKEGGKWAAAWGENEDDPDYVTVSRIAKFEPPNRLVLADFDSYSKWGPLPFEADLSSEFIVESLASGSRLKVIQDGFPMDSIADDFYAACEKGWHDTFDGIRKHLANSSSAG